MNTKYAAAIQPKPCAPDRVHGRASRPSSSMPPTPSTSGWSAGFINVPQSGPELPIPETISTLCAATSFTFCVNGWSAKSGPPIERLSTCTRR